MRNRMVSFWHGLACLFLSGYHLYFEFNGCGDPLTSLEQFTLVMSGGYFLYDLCCMTWFGLLDAAMLIHHSLCVGGIWILLAKGDSAFAIVHGLFVAEVSNPAMHTRVILRHLGYRYTRAYEVAEYMYFSLFFFGRVIMGHPVVWNTVTCQTINYFVRFVSLGILAQSYLFLYRMYFILGARIKETTERA
eukprot:CAMPEP_0176374756 /NCGR_PEP_ID=MMETSP0126-20121128/26992_1 /TAXON_ID=141414 ORGANISM="Strombidinopsis acuminatum, Strain SPMC142" /NCGR_SAMPLE_ID=MMETSP0126 /ASSEMBLY_ACC=CAM_ASM_000229 /LENGTH=189 /DNA_ID=CAMNT_0017735483 /DNA_START=115 /DNA_END=684 /DNA_ORIENTATION=+